MFLEYVNYYFNIIIKYYYDIYIKCNEGDLQ